MPAFDAPTSLALLFGVANYEKPDLFDSMPWVANNVNVLKELLIDSDLFGFAPDRVYCRVDPTNGSIAEALDEVREKQPGLDTLFVYYCGHGVVEAGRYFLTGRDAGKTAAQKLAFEEFEKLFLRINAQRKILVLDSCFSGRAISGHLSNANSVMEANIERLTNAEQKEVQINKSRKGTYVLASADRDKPARSANDKGDLTAFTDLFVKRLKTGFDHVDGERVTINSIVEAVSIDAVQLNLPEPVRSDKFGLGDWAFVGNAAVLKRKNLGASITEEVRSEIKSAVSAVEKQLSDDISVVKTSLDSIRSEIKNLQNRAPPELSPSPVSPVLSPSTAPPLMFVSVDPLPEGSAISRLMLKLYSVVFFVPILAIGGAALIKVYSNRPDTTQGDILIARTGLSVLYLLGLVVLEIGSRVSYDLRFTYRSGLPMIVNSSLAGPILAIARFVRITGVAWFFWAMVTGVVLTWFAPSLLQFFAGTR